MFWNNTTMFLFLPFALIGAILGGFALWQSARYNQVYWFIALIIFNPSIVLPALYLLFFQKSKN